MPTSGHQECRKMKITKRLLQAKSETQGVKLEKLKFVDLSHHGIAAIEHLEEGRGIQMLLLQSNNISIIENLAHCHQLWHIDISCNDVTNLYALSRFMALGYLNLSYNNLSWSELMKIRHMHILELSLRGNPKLEKDPNYRFHVIDCMPGAWMLDSQQITAAKRLQVEEFFQRSALTAHPVRRKLTREPFIPSSLKKLQTEGTYGIRTVHLMMRFPKSGALNVATDRQRLQYLAYNLREDLRVEYECRHSKFNSLPLPDFESLLTARQSSINQCNVLLLLLVTFLEFSLPFDLLQETVTCAKLDNLSETDVRLLFSLPKTYVLRLAAILLSAVKIDRDDNKSTGLYEKLYLSLHCALNESIRANNRHKLSIKHRPPHRYRDLRSLLGCEAIQLFCIVPGFYSYLSDNKSVSELVTQATDDGAAIDKVADLIRRIQSEGGDDHRVVEEVADYLSSTVQGRIKRLQGKPMVPRMTSCFSSVMKRKSPRRPKSTPLHNSSLMAAGLPSPRNDFTVSRPGTGASRVSPIGSVWDPERQPKLRDKVLLGPQSLAFVLALPEHGVALIQMENAVALNPSTVSLSKCSDGHYAYLDLTQFTWEWKHSYWKPTGTTGDKITLHDDVELAAVGFNPPAIDDDSPSASDEECREDAALHPSPRESDEEFPLPISALMKDKLKLSQPSRPLSAPLQPAVTPGMGSEPPVSYRRSSGSEDGVHEHETPVGSGGMLYDCVRCAMNLVEENNRTVTSHAGNGSTQHNRHGVPLLSTMPGTDASVPTTPQSPDTAPRADWLADKQHRISVDLNPEEWRETKLDEDSELVPEIVQRLGSSQRPKTAHQRPKASHQRPKTAHQRPKSSMKSGMVPRPSTASSLYRRKQPGSPIMIQTGNHWLAGGRDVSYQERRANFQKTHHTPGWLEGAPGRPRSVGPRRKTHYPVMPPRAKSAGAKRADAPSLWVGISKSSNQPPPSPATSDLSLPPSPSTSPSPPAVPDYMVQSRKQNYPSYAPLFGAPKRPPSPLQMAVK